MFIRSLTAKSENSMCSSGHQCPDVLELESGDFAIIGNDITEIATAKLPKGSGCGPNERIVRIPRKLLLEVKRAIPETV